MARSGRRSLRKRIWVPKNNPELCLLNLSNVQNRKRSGMDRISGFIVFFLAVVIFWEGRKISIGGIHSPGPGFFPILVAALLLVFSLFLIIPKRKRENEGQPPLAWSTVLRRLVPVLAVLLAYFFLLEYLGFLVTGFLLMTFLFAEVGSLRWYGAVPWAFISIGLAYLLFGVLMHSNLPRGVLGF